MKKRKCRTSKQAAVLWRRTAIARASALGWNKKKDMMSPRRAQSLRRPRTLNHPQASLLLALLQRLPLTPSRCAPRLPPVPWRRHRFQPPYRVIPCLRLRIVAYGIASESLLVRVRNRPSHEVPLLTACSTAERVVERSCLETSLWIWHPRRLLSY